MRIPGAGRLAEAARVRRRDRGLRTGRPDDVARAWLRVVRDLPVEGLHVTSGARRLLVLPKTGGTEDAVATLSGRGDVGLGLATLPRAELKEAFRSLIGPGHELLRDVDHRPGDAAFDDAKARYRDFLAPVMARLRDECGLAGVLGANVTYYAERELAGACEDIGLPFLVLHKESIRSPRQREAFTRAYRERTGPFTGRAVATYNTAERDSQVTGGVVADATVVGCPRIDELHAWRLGHQDPAAATGPVVLFAIDPRAGTWTPYDGEEDLGAPRWERLARDTEAAFVDLARRHPAHPFVIKAKVGHGERLQARLDTDLPGGLPGNVRVLTSGTATDLIVRAAVIVAFNSTVVAEGLAAGVPVVVPAYGEAAEPDAQPWIHPLGDAVNRVTSPDDLATVVLAAQGARAGRAGRAARAGGSGPDSGPDSGPGSGPGAPGGSLTRSARDTLDALVGNSDGRAADRAWAWLQHHLG